ncbi:ephexin-1 [Oncorhynchus tshawytscha]|uniref:Neuronal guanine nucleotide exchange factor n=1 Tax=Oncorhynchus tshawytscha TaxID=74940 RepID=A0A8C8CI89_ONCTS|nr:ephexin-1 [Oncorhynchus tshawytscha]XP_024301279.1 ephexin-1 [Oncorhynchus tshawytscha]
MAMTALFRGKWGQKSQEPPEKQPAASVHSTNHEEEEEDDRVIAPIRRNSRFYRSMRKKRLASSEQLESPAVSLRPGPEPSPGSRSSSSSLCVPDLQKPLQSPRAQRTPTSPRQLHSGTALPSNGELRSPHTLTSPASSPLWTRRGGGGGGGGRKGADASPASGQCGGGSTSSSSVSSARLYRTHGMHTHTEDMESLSERTATACSVREPGGGTQSPQPAEEEVNEEGIKLRLVSNRERASSTPLKVEPICYSLNIVKNVAFLYQEYRDTSKQQEIEQRRQQDGLTSGVSAGLGVTSPPALQLQLRNNSRSLSLWQNLEVVQQSGLLTQLPQREVIIQEAMFELVTSEASYYKSLEVLETHFLKNPVLVNTLSQSDMHFLFSNIEEVMKASERFLMDLENRIEQSLQISDVCDIVYDHAIKHFHVFITYVINQVYQEKNYRRILQGNQSFREAMAQLENQPHVRGLSFTSFLILPFQRITRLKMLVQNILKRAEENSDMEANAIKAHQQLEQIVKECNEGVRKMSRTEELISIEKTLEFKSKSVPVISHSRWLLKKGEVQQMAGPKSTRTMRSKKLHHPVYLFLFNNLLLITKRSSSGEKFQVLDSCTRAMLRTEDMEDQGQMLANVFNLKLLENQEERHVSYMLKTSSMSDKLRWICALTPNRRTRFMSTSARQPASPQVQCIQSYSSQEPDELSIEMADVLNILERTDDGWMMGERLHDGEKGWFPCRVVEEIKNQEVRAQNLRECQRIHLAQEGGASSGSRLGSRGGRRTPKTPKVSNFFGTWTDPSEEEQ